MFHFHTISWWTSFAAFRCLSFLLYYCKKHVYEPDIVGQSMLNPSQTSIPQGFTVVIIAIAIFKIYDYLTTRYNKFSKAIEPDPVLLVKDGKIIDEAMKKVKISRKELESYLRLTGIDDISEIKSSHLEINGQVSFVKKK